MKASTNYTAPTPPAPPQYDEHGFCVVRCKEDSEEHICIYNLYGATFIKKNKHVSYCSRKFLEDHYAIIDLPASITITFSK